MSKCIVGLMLVDAPHSALNNAGANPDARTENAVAVKVIRKGRDVYPYVSGQAVRYWWRETLKERKEWKLSPITREKKVAFTEANPFKYPDDDVFGYMRAETEEYTEKQKDKKTGIEKDVSTKKNITVTRISPFKCSPLISVAPCNIVDDFGVMSRHEGDPVIYEHQFYSTVLKGIFSLDIDAVGKFSDVNRTGYKNINQQQKDLAKEYNATNVDNLWILPKDKRLERIKNTIEAIPFLFGGAKLTSHLTDVAPRFLVLSALDMGNHIFMNIPKADGVNATINIEALQEVLKDYGDHFLTDLFIGRRAGFLDDLKPSLEKLKETKIGSQKKEIVVTSPNESVIEFVKQLEPLII